MSTLEKSGILLQEVVKRLGTFASTKLAEKWDNVGLLVEPSGCHRVEKILLTNDLTQAVMNESIDKSVNLIISYHPPIFTPLKKLCQGNWKERIVTNAIENRIAIYSPHTSYDALKGGVNDWLLKGFGSGIVNPIIQSFNSGEVTTDTEEMNNCYKIKIITAEKTENLTGLMNLLENMKEILKVNLTRINERYQLEVYVVSSEAAISNVYSLINDSKIVHTTSEILKLEKFPLIGYGMGRILQLNESITIADAILRVKKHLDLPYVRLGLARKGSVTKKVSSIAVCAGSGSSVLNGVNADLYVTGEMSHHEVLHATESGRSVILCDHSNTERGFLKTLPPVIQDWFNGDIAVEVSVSDKDPLTIM